MSNKSTNPNVNGKKAASAKQPAEPPIDKGNPIPPGLNPGEGFYTKFTTRKGNTFYARDYGYKAWPIGRRKKG
jgi:hypothetical protein